MAKTLRKRTLKKSSQKLRKNKRKILFNKKFTKNKKKTKKNFLRKSSRKRRKHLRKYKGGFWTTCDKCMRHENCIGRACMNDCGYCTIQAFELPGMNNLFRDHQYYQGLSQQAFMKRVNKWLKSKGYKNLIVMENTIGANRPQPSQLAKFLRNNGGDNEFIPICLGWPHGESGHWLVGGRVNGEAVIIEPQQNPNNMRGRDFETYATRKHNNNTQTINLTEERELGLAQAKIYTWDQDNQDFLEQNTNNKYFDQGKRLSRLTYYTITSAFDSNIEHKIIKTRNGIEIRVRESDGDGNVKVGKRVKHGDRYQLENEESSGETKSTNIQCGICNESKPPSQFSNRQKLKGRSRKCKGCITSESRTNPNPKSSSSSTWTCQVCTLINSNSNSNCMACTTPRSSSPLPISNITNINRVRAQRSSPEWNLSCGICKQKMARRDHPPGKHSCDSCKSNIYNTCWCCRKCDIDYCERCVCNFCGEIRSQHVTVTRQASMAHHPTVKMCRPLSGAPNMTPYQNTIYNYCAYCKLGRNYHIKFNNKLYCPFIFSPSGNGS